MNKLLIFGVGPLVLGAIVYVFQVFGYQFIFNRPWMALTFFGYVLANIGLVGDALTIGVVK